MPVFPNRTAECYAYPTNEGSSIADCLKNQETTSPVSTQPSKGNHVTLSNPLNAQREPKPPTNIPPLPTCTPTPTHITSFTMRCSLPLRHSRITTALNTSKASNWPAATLSMPLTARAQLYNPMHMRASSHGPIGLVHHQPSQDRTAHLTQHRIVATKVRRNQLFTDLVKAIWKPALTANGRLPNNWPFSSEVFSG